MQSLCSIFLATYLFIYLLYLLKKIIYLATLGLSYSMQAL